MPQTVAAAASAPERTASSAVSSKDRPLLATAASRAEPRFVQIGDVPQAIGTGMAAESPVGWDMWSPAGSPPMLELQQPKDTEQIDQPG